MRLRYLLKKELLQLRRNPALFRMAIFMPLMQTIFLSYATNLDVVNVPVVIWDADHTVTSRRIVDLIAAQPTFRLVGLRLSPAQLQQDLDDGAATLALTIPAGFTRELDKAQARTQLLIDGTESTTTTVAAAYLGMILADYGTQVQLRLARRRGLEMRLGQVRGEPRVLYNPALRTLWFMAPAILALVLTTLMQNLTALSIARERELGTLEQIAMTPVKPVEFLLGKLMPFGLIGLGDSAFITFIVVHGLHVPFRGNFVVLALATVLFLFAVLGLGLLVSTVSANQQQAQLTNFFLSFPSMLLSGFMFPAWNLPRGLRPVSALVPMTHFLEITRGVFLRGSGLEALWPRFLWLLGLAVTFFGLGVLRFHKRLD